MIFQLDNALLEPGHLILEHVSVHTHVLLCFVKPKANPLPRHLLHFGFLLLDVVFNEVLKVIALSVQNSTNQLSVV